MNFLLKRIEIVMSFKPSKRQNSSHQRKVGTESVGLKRCFHMRYTIERYFYSPIINILTKKGNLEASVSSFLVLQLLVKISHMKKLSVIFISEQ